MGKVIRQVRKEKGLTLLELASLYGLSVSSLSQMEKGQRGTFPSLPV